jgi:archaellin
MIVLMAMIILGIALSAMIIGLSGSAQDITDKTTSRIGAELGLTE